MRLFLETNFILELTLKQSEAGVAEGLVDAAKRGEIGLAMPAFSLIEPYYKLAGDKRKRVKLLEAIDEEVDQMVRSSGFESLRDQSIALTTALTDKADADRKEFEVHLEALSKIATIIPLTAEVIRDSKLVDLAPFDGLVFASILSNLKSDPVAEGVFASKDKKGFLQKSVVSKLQDMNCTVVPTFKDAMAFINARRPGGAKST